MEKNPTENQIPKIENIVEDQSPTVGKIAKALANAQKDIMGAKKAQ